MKTLLITDLEGFSVIATGEQSEILQQYNDLVRKKYKEGGFTTEDDSDDLHENNRCMSFYHGETQDEKHYAFSIIVCDGVASFVTPAT